MDIRKAAVTVCACILLTGFSAVPEEEPQEPGMGDCDKYSPEKHVFFGDTHVHTRLSMDAAQNGTTASPDQAYQHAKDVQGLDFVGLSDHSEYLAEADVCFNRDSLAYSGPYCQLMRGTDSGATLFDTAAFLIGVAPVAGKNGVLDFVSVCSVWPGLCEDRLVKTWDEVQAAADRHYAPYNDDGCSFTTFVGYEWTGSPGFDNEHRNVFFRDENVPELPISFFDAPTPEQLWSKLDNQCNNSNGCEALTIPHNSNLGGGEMFNPVTESSDGTVTPYSYELARQRARMEPLVEIFQHKGDSECTPGNVPFGSNDEFCGFEKVVTNICENGEGYSRDGCTPLCSDFELLLGGGFTGVCIEPRDFVRGALRRGLAEQQRTGMNPFQFGFVGSTDTHNGTPGQTEEEDWNGALGKGDDTLAERTGQLAVGDNPIANLAARIVPGFAALQGFTNAAVYNPGGLAAVWAEQNTRHALFDAMQRREAYATSGTRITLRTFTGADVPSTICSSSNFAGTGYATGVPMGGELTANSNAPRVAISAMAAPDSLPLQRVQVIKGWVDADGQTHEKVYNVAGDLKDYGGDPGVDLNTCQSTRTTGYSSMCAVWQDPDFEPQQNAFYYTRVLENPSCRWNRRECNEALSGKTQPEIDAIAADAEHPLHSCASGKLTDTIQERAWSSPVWYKGS